MKFISKLKALPFLSLPLLFPPQACAHAFGQQYTLPVPFWLYAYSAAAAIIISFGIIGFFLKSNKNTSSFPQIEITNWKIIKFFKNRHVTSLFKGISICLFLMTIFSGLIGNSNPTLNFNMTFFWIIFLLGFTYLCILFGNLYSYLSPWKIISDSIKIKKTGIIEYPPSLGYYPAFIFYFILIWIELIGKFDPFQLSITIIFYNIIMLMGILVLGDKNWFKYFDVFSVFFRIVGKVSFLKREGEKAYLRLPFSGLISEEADSLSFLLFILFMLSSTAFDGFSETQAWSNLFFFIPQNLREIFGDNFLRVLGTLGLFLFPFIYLGIYFVVIYLVKKISGTKKTVKELLLMFAFSLIPIALVYNLAHYYTLLLIQGQAIISQISDPLGKGWNLFGTRNFTPNIGVIDTNTIWHSQVAFILIGHIVAVYIAHIVALKSFSSYRNTLISQIPVLILMIIYTVIGLWILSQPLTTGL